MAHWSHKQREQSAWRYFLDDLDCDVLLFQEAAPIQDILQPDQLVWNKIGGNRPWGSGIYSKHHKIKEHAFRNNFFGAVTAAEITIQPAGNFIFISLYGLMEKLNGTVYSIPNLHRIFSDLTEILEAPQTKDRVIIGGDLNASLQFDQQQKGNAHKVLFDRIKQFGLLNCFDLFFDDFVQTHRHRKSSKPWQNDYFLVSKKLSEFLEQCVVIDNDKARQFSDHNPVVITLNI